MFFVVFIVISATNIAAYFINVVANLPRQSSMVTPVSEPLTHFFHAFQVNTSVTKIDVSSNEVSSSWQATLSALAKVH